MTGPLLPPEPPDDKDAKRREKELRRLEMEKGVLDPALRYKALLNALELGQDLIELADRKARFALVIISVLNAVALVLVVRGTGAVLPPAGPWAFLVQVELVTYTIVTIYYIWQAIEALRPRGAGETTRDALPTEVVAGESMRVLFHSDIVRRDKASYRRLWEQVRMDNLIAELSDQLHAVSQINATKYAALTRLYRGVGLMTMMLTTTLVTLAVYRLMR